MIKGVIKYYQKQVGVIKIHPPEGNLHQIILIRHAEPDIKGRRFYTNAHFLEYEKSYFHSRVKPFKQPPVDISTLPVAKVYHSHITRALHTAELIFTDPVEFISDKRFREFERDSIRMLIPLPVKWLKFLSRMMWFLGFSSEKVESFKKARERVVSNAKFLSQKAAEDKIVILVAHGLHNRFIVKELKKNGWQMLYNGGKDFLGMQILGRMRENRLV